MARRSLIEAIAGDRSRIRELKADLQGRSPNGGNPQGYRDRMANLKATQQMLRTREAALAKSGITITRIGRAGVTGGAAGH